MASWIHYWTKPAPRADEQTIHSNDSAEDFVYNEYQSRDVERRAALHHIPRHAPPAHGQSETRRLMHRHSRRREEGQDLDNLRETIKEHGRRSSRCSTTLVSRPTLQYSTSFSAQGRTGHSARIWSVDSKVGSFDFVVGKPKAARLPDVRTYLDESDRSSVTTSSSRGSEWTNMPGARR